MSTNANSMINEAVEPEVKNGAPKNRKAKRFDRSQAFREKKGDEFMIANQQRLHDKLFADFGGFEKYTATTTSDASKRPVILPITTRGVVLALSQAIRVVRQQMSTPPPIDEMALYRATMLQVEVKMYLANKVQHLDASSRVENAYPRSFVLADVVQMVEATPRNFSAVAAIINAIGNFTYQNDVFYPRFDTTDLGMGINKLITYCNEVIDPSDFAIHPHRRTESVVPGVSWEDYQIPHPDGGEAVVAVRATEAPLMGPYTLELMRTDLEAMRNLIGTLAGKTAFKRLCGELHFTSDGSPSQLVCSEVAALQHDHGPSEFWSPRLLTHQCRIFGILMLCGETGDGIRNESCSVEVFSKSYHAINLAMYS